MPAFYHVFIKPKRGVARKTVEAKLNLAVDWIRYSPSDYVIYTTSNHVKWWARLQEFVKPDGRLFICKLDISSRQGWMNKSFWKWIKKDRTSKGN